MSTPIAVSRRLSSGYNQPKYLPDSSLDPLPRFAINRKTVALHAGVIGGFLVFAVIMWWRVWVTGHPSSTITCQCGDVSEALGFLAWTPWAVVHGHNPLLSNAIYAGQGGANMLVNASWIAFSFLFAPITWLFGPIATFNVVVTLAPVVSGWCFFLAVRKFTSFVPGQIIAAALYGFSPLIVASDPYGHFFQIWLIYPPLAFLCLYDLFVTQRHRPVLLGLGFGLLTVVEFFTSTEVLAISAVMSVIGVVVVAALAPRAAWARRRHILLGLSVAGGIAAIFLAYPAWFATAGPRHIVGYAWPGTPQGGIHAGDVVSAGLNIHHPSAATELGGYFGNIGPNVSYLGLPLLVFLIVSAIVWWKNRVAWVVLAVGLAAYALSLGDTNHWTPWRLVGRIPLVGDVIPGRFCAITIFAAALLLALSSDGWWRVAEHYQERRAQQPHRRQSGHLLGVSGAFLTLVTAATLIPVATAYSFPLVVHNKPMPLWFRHVAPRLPQGTEVLAYPYPDGPVSQAMGWQAVDDLRFRLVGGFAIVPGGDGRHSSGVSPLGGTVSVLDRLSLDLWGPLPLATPDAVRQVRASLQHWGVQVVVVTSQGRDPTYASGYLTAVLGRPPRLEAGALVWYGLGRNQPLSIDPAVVMACESTSPKTLGLLVSQCVLKAGQGHTSAAR